MFCSIAFDDNCLLTRWKVFSIGLISGEQGGMANILHPTSSIAQCAAIETWRGSLSCINNFTQGFELFSNIAGKHWWTSSPNDPPVSVPKYCSQLITPFPIDYSNNEVSHMTTALFLFPFSCSRQTFLRFAPCHGRSWSCLVSRVGFMRESNTVEIETNTLCPKMLW